jgi:chaperonin cofactor prefoldin
MTTNPLLLAFPNFVKSELIEIDCLRELDRALESVSSEPLQNTEETLNKWLRNHKDIRNQLREFEESTREITKVKADTGKIGGIGNVFQELSEAVKQKLKESEKGK